jgi:hypothetical protein
MGWCGSYSPGGGSCLITVGKTITISPEETSDRHLVGDVESPCHFPGMFGPDGLLGDSLDVFYDSKEDQT